jgi:tuberculosinol/isotuberculosinol synthase
MELEEFLQLPATEVAALVKERGPKVCVFPINGTRRWFTLEHGQQEWEDPLAAYMDLASQNHIGLYRLFFDHGITTLLTPAFGPDLLLRSDEYVRRVGAQGLARLATGSEFLSFYDEYDVRVHFYGDHRRALAETSFARLSDLFDAATERTRAHERFRLFFGIFANDATQTVVKYSIQYFQQHGHVPNKRELIEMYYGEYVAPVDLFIGFDRFSAFDMPLVATGEEDLYFTVSPSPYMDQDQLRRILYDHLFTRRALEPDYTDLSGDELQALRKFYVKHRGYTLGTGKLLHRIWVPDIQE